MLRTLWTLTFVVPLSVLAQEVCNNGIDDDNNGLIDLNDPACPCATVVEPPALQSYIRNHSFEDQMCCPFGFVHPFSPPWLSCASGWQQATSATSDYFHECGYSPAGMPLPPPDGNGAVGFYASPGYFEYVGTCLTFPAPANPLLAGTTYTLSLWIAAAGADGTHAQSPEQADPSVFVEQLPLALFGYANGCVPFPIATMDCIGYEPGWNELGRVMVQPSWQWQQVSITFTPTEEIHSVIIGGGCDVPASFGQGQWVTDSQGNTTSVSPYFLVDDLMLTIAQDQVLTPVTAVGGICAGDAVATAVPPASATGHQWYLDGVAVVGQTGLTLPISALDLDGGMYTLASTYAGECLMGSTYVLPAGDPHPLPLLLPTQGCSPLTVAFSDTTASTSTVQWNLGDGTFATDSTLDHTYWDAGSYDVRLTVIDGAGCQGDTLLVDAVTVHPAATGLIEAQPALTDT
ncbi:MAG TPA: PKD domain-containing protein [Flavobacteriales bacterium]